MGRREGWYCSFLGLVGIKFGHFLHVDPYTLAVKEHEVHCLDWRGHCWHKIAGDGFQDELSGCLLWEAISRRGKKKKRKENQDLLNKLLTIWPCRERSVFFLHHSTVNRTTKPAFTVWIRKYKLVCLGKTSNVQTEEKHSKNINTESTYVNGLNLTVSDVSIILI